MADKEIRSGMAERDEIDRMVSFMRQRGEPERAISEAIKDKLDRFAKTMDGADWDELFRSCNMDNIRERSISADLREWLSGTTGAFPIGDAIREMNLTHQNDKAAVYVAIGRMLKAGEVERYGTRNGWYRRPETGAEEMNWREAPTKGVHLILPMGLHEYVNLYCGNIIIIAGEMNVGKTGFLLNVVRDNMDKWKVHYFNSEMGETEFKIRLSKFPDMQEEDWRLTAYNRNGAFADVIVPDDLNIIDFMECYDEFWRIGGWIRDIHTKLRKGLAVIAIQKKEGLVFGRGGDMTAEKARLYLSMSHDWSRRVGVLKIVKAKNFKGEINPNGYVQEFKLVQGAKFIPQGIWHHPEDAEDAGIKPQSKQRLWWNK